jgi:hypothetical protein
MSLSKKNQNVLIDAMADKKAALELVAAVMARVPLSAHAQQAVIGNLCANKKAGQEVIAAVVSGAKLSDFAARKVIICMAGDNAGQAGNDLINFIQSVPNSKKIML